MMNLSIVTNFSDGQLRILIMTVGLILIANVPIYTDP
jgi:hypothetical protein